MQKKILTGQSIPIDSSSKKIKAMIYRDNGNIILTTTIPETKRHGFNDYALYENPYSWGSGANAIGLKSMDFVELQLYSSDCTTVLTNDGIVAIFYGKDSSGNYAYAAIYDLLATYDDTYSSVDSSSTDEDARISLLVDDGAHLEAYHYLLSISDGKFLANAISESSSKQIVSIDCDRVTLSNNQFLSCMTETNGDSEIYYPGYFNTSETSFSAVSIKKKSGYNMRIYPTLSDTPGISVANGSISSSSDDLWNIKVNGSAMDDESIIFLDLTTSGSDSNLNDHVIELW